MGMNSTAWLLYVRDPNQRLQLRPELYQPLVQSEFIFLRDVTGTTPGRAGTKHTHEESNTGVDKKAKSGNES